MRAVLSLGGNLGDPRAQFAVALRALDDDPGIRVAAVSHAYETVPLGKTDQPQFLNCAAFVDADMPPEVLLARTQAVEDALGRVRFERWGPRTLDIDLICAGEAALDGRDLTLPHPRAHERAFVLIPWLELDPEACLLGRSVAQLIASLPEQGVRRAGTVPGWSDRGIQ